MGKLVVIGADDQTIGAITRAFSVNSQVDVVFIDSIDESEMCRIASRGELAAVVFGLRSMRLYQDLWSRVSAENDCLRAAKLLLVRRGVCSATVYRALAHGIHDVIELDQSAEAFAADMSTAIFSNRPVCEKLFVAGVDVMRPAGSPRICVHDETERNIVGMIAAGYMDREIAEIVHYSHQTIRNKISRILEDSDLRNRTQLAAAFLIERIIADVESGGGSVLQPG